jgi:hypothetical protein
MLLLHHDHHKLACRAGARRAKAEASGRTRTDEFDFTKLVLWLLEARGLGKWRSHVDLHHELPASQTGVQN